MQNIERLIVLNLIRDMRAQGYNVAAVWDGEEYQIADGKTDSRK